MRGGQWQVLRLIEQLNQMGIENTLLTSADSPLAAHYPSSKPFTVSTLRHSWREFDIIHAHDGRSHTWCALLNVKPLVVSRRVAFPIKKSFLSVWKYKKPQMFIAVSRNVASVLGEAGIPANRIRVIYDGVKDFAWHSDHTGGPVSPASDDPQKGSDLLMASGIKMTFSNYLGHDLRTANCFLYISRQEGLGSAILLAMAAGVPVIASCVGGIPELVEHEVTGLLVENDPKEIRSAWERLQMDKPLALKLASNAKERVRHAFTAQHMASQTLKVYQELL